MNKRSYMDGLVEENRKLRVENEKLRALAWSGFQQLKEVHRALTDDVRMSRHGGVLRKLRGIIFALKHGPYMDLDTPLTHGFKKLRHELLKVSDEEMLKSLARRLDSDPTFWYKTAVRGNDAANNQEP